MRKLILVYNPRSSRQEAIEKDVLEPLRQVRGFLISKFEVKQANVQQNAIQLAKIIEEGDLVVAAGGDGTATMAANGILRSGVQASIGVLAYGNFNDTAVTLGAKSLTEIVAKFKAGKTREIYPLKVSVNGELWRYALSYVTIGMMAEATGVFEEEGMRGKAASHLKSYWKLAMWYYKNRRRYAGAEDVVVMNGPRMAGVLKGKNYLAEAEKFGVGEFRLRWSLPLFGFMMRGMLGRVLVKETSEVKYEFKKEVWMQAEGERELIKGEIKIEKGEKLRVV